MFAWVVERVPEGVPVNVGVFDLEDDLDCVRVRVSDAVWDGDSDNVWDGDG